MQQNGDVTISMGTPDRAFLLQQGGVSHKNTSLQIINSEVLGISVILRV